MSSEPAPPAAAGDVPLPAAAGDVPLPAAAGEAAPRLPEAVRLRVVALAADRLGALPAEEVPAPLRAFARFTPGKRARLAAAPLGAALEADPVFRQRIAEALRLALPDLVAGVEAGLPLSAAPPADVAAAAYLVRPAGWTTYVERAAEDMARDDRLTRSSAARETVTRLQEQLETLRATARRETERLRGELAAARAEADDLRRRLREAQSRSRRDEAVVQAARDAAAEERAAAQAAATAAEAEARRLRSRSAAAEAALETARRAVRDGRGAEDVRLWVLLDTLLGVAQGLRRELALPPATSRPADALVDEAVTAADATLSPLSGVGSRGLAEDDPAHLDVLLGVPGVHLVVDGYNVTMSGYGNQSLEAQRSRLLSGLAGLAARTGAEVTCVFDGAERPASIAVAAPRGVRLLFSRPDETADELIRRLVRGEPAGRPVVVVSSDREIADGVRAAGARPVPSLALVRRLDRA